MSKSSSCNKTNCCNRSKNPEDYSKYYLLSDGRGRCWFDC